MQPIPIKTAPADLAGRRSATLPHSHPERVLLLLPCRPQRRRLRARRELLEFDRSQRICAPRPCGTCGRRRCLRWHSKGGFAGENDLIVVCGAVGGDGASLLVAHTLLIRVIGSPFAVITRFFHARRRTTGSSCTASASQ